MNGKPEPDARERCLEIARDWVQRRQGSAAELILALEDGVGWAARHAVMGVLEQLRAEKKLDPAVRKYLSYTLNAGAMREALAEGLNPNSEHQSSLDELLIRSRRFRQSKKFTEAVEFLAKFREYSPFNNMLVYLQNPMATYFATARLWHKNFGRTVKDEARGMIILAPRTPVLLVYDIADTEGPPLPDKLEVFGRVSGALDAAILDRTLRNCERDKILVERKSMGRLRGGFATMRVRHDKWKMRVGLSAELDDAASYAALCHELAHIYLGHVGPDKDGWWPFRANLPEAVMEIEAEAVSYIVSRRAGLKMRAAEYLSSFVDDDDNVEGMSLDLVGRTASRLEEMGRRLLPPRNKRSEDYQP